ncbi:unnamed protein product [Hydatigera taeniaeformis]|uniref:Reverse transcriptase domain-containing protein n=1 Tax=Hydatigena taeniaeformis TaxID=6205 RepID=A0A0R3WWL4_HYDTA|nr:unnamed protein product [Hydatigera taeniaeformis]
MGIVLIRNEVESINDCRPVQIKLHLCQENSNTAFYDSPTYSPVVGEFAYSSEPMHTDVIDESALWKMVREQEAELRRAHYNLPRTDPPITTNKVDEEKTTEFETSAVLITPRLYELSTSSEEEDYEVKGPPNSKDPLEVGVTAAALKGLDDLLDPGHGRGTSIGD